LFYAFPGFWHSKKWKILRRRSPLLAVRVGIKMMLERIFNPLRDDMRKK